MTDRDVGGRPPLHDGFIGAEGELSGPRLNGSRSAPGGKRVSLRFPGDDLEQAYLQDEYQRNRPWILGSLALGLAITLLFYPLDRLFIPADALPGVHAVRLLLLATMPLVAAIAVAIIRHASHALPIIFACISVYGLAWSLLRSIAGPSAEPYLAFGVAQTILFTYACLGLPFRWSAPAVFITLGPILVLAGRQGLTTVDCWYTTASLVTVALIASYAAVRHEYASRERFLALRRFDAEYQRRLSSERERIAWLGVIAGFVRHELRNAMAGIGSSLELLERSQLPEGRGSYIQRARRSLQFMRSVLDQVANASNLDTALSRQELEAVDLSSVVEGLRDDFSPESTGVTFSFATVPGLFVRGNADSLRQMLEKLLNNAVEHSDRSRPIQVALGAEGPTARLVVENYGDPLPSDTQVLFRPFVSRSRAASEGHLGLGLYVASVIVRSHGGTIRAEPTPDRAGARFTIELPLLPG